MEDHQIIDLFWERSEQAIVEASRKYGAYLGVIAHNILGNREDAEECVNDTYLHAWNAIPPGRPSFLKCFLGKITRNLSIDRYHMLRTKKRGGGEMQLLLSELEYCIPAAANVETHMEDQEIAEVINIFLGRLSPEKRMFFVRRYWYGDSVEEIAARFHVSGSKVKSALFRTRRALKTCLEKEGVVL